jgi:AraC-like DNA-binding protein
MDNEMVKALNRSNAAVVTPTDHLDRIYAIAEGRVILTPDDPVARSWQRCVNGYGLDPASPEAPRILTSIELKAFREPLARLVVSAQDELDRLYKVVGQARYVILLCDSKGVAIDHRGSPTDVDQFAYWGIWLGGVWSEEIEGTNGIGTCIAEGRPVTIHRSQHFRARHITLSCSAAPIFDGDGKLIAVLDVSSSDPNLSEGSHVLTGALTEASARAIEERFFREQFRREWIIAVAAPDGAGATMLFAVDQHQRIVGADRNARTILSRSNGGVEENLWAVFERAHALFRRKDHDDLSVQLVPAGTGEHWPALITPPERASGEWRNPEHGGLHSRPRLAMLGSWRQAALPRPARGGLPPRALRRVREYVDTHLEETIRLETLAATSGLSVYHFTRAFKQSQGVTPHSYLLQRRIERAQELLTTTDLPMARVAFATGFSNQSHFARRFRELVGMPPSTFKWLKR